jgi:hypothetical protein
MNALTRLSIKLSRLAEMRTHICSAAARQERYGQRVCEWWRPRRPRINQIYGCSPRYTFINSLSAAPHSRLSMLVAQQNTYANRRASFVSALENWPLRTEQSPRHTRHAKIFHITWSIIVKRRAWTKKNDKARDLWEKNANICSMNEWTYTMRVVFIAAPQTPHWKYVYVLCKYFLLLRRFDNIKFYAEAIFYFKNGRKKKGWEI